jgi:hypothetical protein
LHVGGDGADFVVDVESEDLHAGLVLHQFEVGFRSSIEWKKAIFETFGIPDS